MIGVSDHMECQYHRLTPHLHSEIREGKSEAVVMPRHQIHNKLSIIIPKPKMQQAPIERLIKLGKKRDRSVNYLAVEAILEYLEREERKR